MRSPPDRGVSVQGRYGPAMTNSGEVRNGSVHSVNRAVSILQVLALRGASGVTQIAGELDVRKSTVFRLLATLEARGLVEQDASRGQYRLGHGVVQLAAGATREYDISVISRPICQELAETIGESVTEAFQGGHRSGDRRRGHNSQGSRAVEGGVRSLNPSAQEPCWSLILPHSTFPMRSSSG